jgi:hypothetical protein
MSYRDCFCLTRLLSIIFIDDKGIEELINKEKDNNKEYTITKALSIVIPALNITVKM